MAPKGRKSGKKGGKKGGKQQKLYKCLLHLPRIKTFTSMAGIKKHNRDRHKKFYKRFCGQCGQCLESDPDKVAHIREEHTYQKKEQTGEASTSRDAAVDESSEDEDIVAGSSEDEDFVRESSEDEEEDDGEDSEDEDA